MRENGGGRHDEVPRWCGGGAMRWWLVERWEKRDVHTRKRGRERARECDDWWGDDTVMDDSSWWHSHRGERLSRDRKSELEIKTQCVTICELGLVWIGFLRFLPWCYCSRNAILHFLLLITISFLLLLLLSFTFLFHLRFCSFTFLFHVSFAFSVWIYGRLVFLVLFPFEDEAQLSLRFRL